MSSPALIKVQQPNYELDFHENKKGTLRVAVRDGKISIVQLNGTLTSQDKKIRCEFMIHLQSIYKSMMQVKYPLKMGFSWEKYTCTHKAIPQDFFTRPTRPKLNELKMLSASKKHLWVFSTGSVMSMRLPDEKVFAILKQMQQEAKGKGMEALATEYNNKAYEALQRNSLLEMQARKRAQKLEDRNAQGNVEAEEQGDYSTVIHKPKLEEKVNDEFSTVVHRPQLQAEEELNSVVLNDLIKDITPTKENNKLKPENISVLPQELLPKKSAGVFRKTWDAFTLVVSKVVDFFQKIFSWMIGK